jgi:hypothetical protein
VVTGFKPIEWRRSEDYKTCSYKTFQKEKEGITNLIIFVQTVRTRILEMCIEGYVNLRRATNHLK